MQNNCSYNPKCRRRDSYNNASGFLENLIGEEGIKTDINVRLERDVYINLGATIVIAGAITIGLYMVVKEILKR